MPTHSQPHDPRTTDDRFCLPKESLDDLVGVLKSQGYQVIAPVCRDGVIVLRPIEAASEIARGVRDRQSPGRYRLEDGDPGMIFDGYVVGHDSPKRFFFPPRQELFTLRIHGERFEVTQRPPEPPRYAFIGLRPCELTAIAVQDRVFGVEAQQQTFRCETETYYGQARERSLLIAVNCTRPGGTCFCASWETGPVVNDRHRYDLAMTELRTGFLMRVGSDRGRELLRRLPVREPTDAEMELEELRLLRAGECMGRTFDTHGVKDLMDRTIEHPRWDQVAHRCLSCGNCTMVCPTCFCSTVTDSNDLATGDVTRTRQWESCYTHQFSYTTAGPARNSIRARYRHWLRHKVGTWWDQFGCSGCVGCGRCITWCPVGIDLTEELAAIRKSERSAESTVTGLPRPSIAEEMELHP